MNFKTVFYTIIKGVALLIITIVLAVIMKVFLFTAFTIPSWSMSPSIMAGDRIIVNKLILGPRLYENWGVFRGEKTKLIRLKGLREVKRNDILVFEFPYKIPDKIQQGGGVFYIKRCVAIPGDTFYIDNGIYKVRGIDAALGYIEKQKKLSKREEATFDEGLRYTFPKDTVHFQWTIKNFGPLYIPAKGDNIEIDSRSVLLYKNLIEYETGSEISIANGVVYLGESLLDNYTFQQNYYFMAGDGVFDSVDSRYWGLLADDLIIGKAAIVWTSKDKKTGKYRWGRFLKKIK